MHPVRIYLKVSKEEERLIVHQTSKLITGEAFLERHRYVRKPYDKHMRIALGGVIATTIGKHKRLYKSSVTHVGMYLSNTVALDSLYENAEHLSLTRNISIQIIEKDMV